MPNNHPLQSLRILDLSRVLAGPWASQTLADLGAEVIKIEHPKSGDDTRQWGPPFLDSNSDSDESFSAYYLCTNRGKKSLTVDIKSDAGQQLLHKLAAQSDVIIENFKVGQLAKYQLDYPTLSQINPKLIYCSITGFGQTGPYATKPGYDYLLQAMSGLMSVTGDADGAPQKVGVAVVDIMTGLYSTIAILAAINERHTSGKGQHIDMSLFDVSVATMANQASNYLISGKSPNRMGNAHPNIVPYQCFETADAPCVIAVGNDAQFQAFCTAIDKPELATDHRYQSNRQRVTNRESLIGLLQPIIQAKPRDYWLELCEQHSIPAAPVNTMQQVFEDPQVIARGLKIPFKTNRGQSFDLVANPIKFSRSQMNYELAPPELGEHNAKLLDDDNLKND